MKPVISIFKLPVLTELRQDICSGSLQLLCSVLRSSLSLCVAFLVFGTVAAQAIPAMPTNPSPGTTGSPGTTLSGNSVTLSWGAVSGATYYSLGVRDIASGNLVVNTTTTATSYSTSLTAGKQYRWNVAAVNSAGSSAYTTPLYFQTPTPVAKPVTPTSLSPGLTSSPGTTLSGNSVTLSWGAVSGATYYSLGVVDVATGNLVVAADPTTTSYSVTLSPNKQYRWNVAAGNSAGLSTYTTVLYFRTPAPVVVPTTPTSPSPGLTSSPGTTLSGNSVTLSWGAVSGATYYSLGLVDVATGAFVVNGTTTATSYTASLTAGKTYRWNVAAGNSTGLSPYTTVLYFQTPSSTTASPTFNPVGGNYTSAQSVTITSATIGATIYYTLNGVDPTSSSTVYTGPVTISSTTTLKAKAVKSGMTDSSVTSGTYTITVPSGPANNNFANRASISSAGGTVTGSNVNATKESGEPIIYYTSERGGKSVWWSWTPSVSGSAVINTLGSSFDTLLAVYTGSSVAGLTLVPNGSNDDYSGNTSQVTINVTAGTTYQIAVDGWNGASGNITLTVTAPTTPMATVASPTFNPVGGNYTSAQSVTITSVTSGATIRYTVNGIDPTSSSTVYTGPVTISSTTTLKAKAFKIGMNDSTVAIGSYTIMTPVVLLLHGMNSDETTWKDFIGDTSYGSIIAPVIYAGVVQSSQQPVADTKGVRYYLVKFGAYDKDHGRIGLEPDCVSTSSKGDSGDFSSFSGQYSHAKEIKDAITNILSQFPSAKILLVGHSRGGIDARAFLQDTSYTTERNAVIGLLTVGTPHLGSPLGRIYGFLNAHPRSSWNTSDWKLVDELRGAAMSGSYSYPKSIDVRRPTIDDLAIGSSPLTQLSNGIVNLPASFKYGTLQFNGARLGLLADYGNWGNVDIFVNSSVTDPTKWFTKFTFDAITSLASNSICQSAPRSNFAGDGIVPFSSQTFSGSGITVTSFTNTQGVILHTGEPANKTDIRSAMKSLVNWWN